MSPLASLLLACCILGCGKSAFRVVPALEPMPESIVARAPLARTFLVEAQPPENEPACVEDGSTAGEPYAPTHDAPEWRVCFSGFRRQLESGVRRTLLGLLTEKSQEPDYVARITKLRLRTGTALRGDTRSYEVDWTFELKDRSGNVVARAFGAMETGQASMDSDQERAEAVRDAEASVLQKIREAVIQSAACQG